MSFFQNLRRKWHVAELERQAATQRSRLPGRLAGLPRWALALIVMLGFGILYYGPLGWALADTETDLTLRPPVEALPPGGSVTAATAATLMLNELDRGGWSPNDTIFKPTAFNSTMPALQIGVQDIVSAATEAMATARPGEDELVDAAEEFAIDPTRRTMRGSFPFFGASAGSRYRAGAEGLIALNDRMADGELDKLNRGATGRLLVSAIGGRLAESTRALDLLVRAESPLDEDPAVRHARIRGQAYAATMLLRGVQADFDALLRDRQLGSAMVEAIEALDVVAGEDPYFVDDEDLTRQAYFLRTAVGALSRMRTGMTS